jgi:hypothetical protein
MYADNNIQGWMGVGELQWLYERAHEFTRIVEIGCWKGRSTHALLSGCKGTVFAIDNFKGNPTEIGEGQPHHEATYNDIHKVFLQNVGHFPNLVTLKMDSMEAVKMFKNKSVDMVFIDGEHTLKEFTQDFEGWRPKCKTLFCGHDKDMDGPERYLRENKIKVISREGIWILCDE